MAENQENDVQEEVVETTNVEQDLVDQQEVETKVEAEVTAPKNEVLEDGTVKLDLSSVEEKAPTSDTNEIKQPVLEQETVEEQQVEEQEPVLQEITEEEVVEKTEELTEEVAEAVEEARESGTPLPENIQKVVDFIDETGGSLEDYVKLNQDYSKLEDNALLREFYSQTKPHLNRDEIDFLMEDNFKYDEEVDEERDIRRKKLALKEQVANAKSHLDGQKSKYYEEIKAGSRLAPEQKKAIDFFNRYNQEAETTQKVVQEQQTNFLNKTNEVFNDKFKGFEYNIGEKKFRFNVKDSDKVKNDQSDINNFIKKFLDKNENMKDATGYHKSLFTANNPDAVAKHFYEQGKADAIKDSIAKSKNINMDPREAQSNVIPTSGWSVKAVPGDTVSDFKIKIRK